MSRLLMIVLTCLVTISCATGPSDNLGQEGESQADIYVQLGVGYMQRGNNAIALDELKKGIEVDPRSSSAHGIIAVLYERLGERDQAEYHYKRSLSLDSDSMRANNNYGRFLCMNGQFSEAEKHFEIAYGNPLNRKKWMVLTNAGDCYLKAGNPGKAETLFRQALEANPHFSEALLSMAEISFAKENFLSTRAYLQRFREVSQHTPESLWIGIQNEHELGEEDAVASYVLILHSKFPDSKEVMLLEEKFPEYR